MNSPLSTFPDVKFRFIWISEFKVGLGVGCVKTVMSGHMVDV